MKRIAPIRVVCFCLLAACEALCQSGRPKVGVPHGQQLRGAGEQRQGRVFRSLPDAPSARVLNSAAKFQKLADQARLFSTIGPAAINTGVLHETQPGITLPEAPSAIMLYKTVPRETGANVFLRKYLNSSVLNRSPRYQPSSSDRVMERATDAASRIFVMRDETGKRKLNTPYFLRVLTSVAADSASRRYRAHSGAAPLSDFGSTIGNDAGMNLLHEFGPGIRQAMTSHMPAFLSKIGEHMSRQENQSPAGSAAR
jgi:hypothetical protein